MTNMPYFLLLMSCLVLQSATASANELIRPSDNIKANVQASSIHNDTGQSQLPEYSTRYDPARDAFKDGTDAIALATRSNRRILIELGGDWCKWCHEMDAFLEQNPDIKQQLHQTFVMLKINVSDRNDNAAFLKAFPKPLGYPHMYVSESNGQVLWSQDTAEFLVNGKYSRDTFLDFFNRWRKTTKTR